VRQNNKYNDQIEIFHVNN